MVTDTWPVPTPDIIYNAPNSVLDTISNIAPARPLTRICDGRLSDPEEAKAAYEEEEMHRCEFTSIAFWWSP